MKLLEVIVTVNGVPLESAILLAPTDPRGEPVELKAGDRIRVALRDRGARAFLLTTESTIT